VDLVRLRWPFLRWPVLALALLVACRARKPPPVDWLPGTSSAETAALLLLDETGAPKVVCLPGRTAAREALPKLALRRILDVGWREGPVIAATAAAAGRPEELVLLAPRQEPRPLAEGVQTAQFSADSSALAYGVGQVSDSEAGLAVLRSYVLELGSGKVVELDGLADPRWEPDGKHLRATAAHGEPGRLAPGRSRWLRARWDRGSGITTFEGPGAAQIPAPAGTAVAWGEGQRSMIDPNQCAVLLSRKGGVRHAIIGRFCRGVSDDRAVRWSPDGRWLAFPHPPAVAIPGSARGSYVDVVSIEGGRHPALTALAANAGAEQLALAVTPRSPWFDWSPAGRFLALQDGAGEVRVYDLATPGIAYAGTGQKPMWSPGGGYLLVLAAGHDADASAVAAFLLRGAGPGARIDLGRVRDARWLPVQACE
jgi:hypothetical protein